MYGLGDSCLLRNCSANSSRSCSDVRPVQHLTTYGSVMIRNRKRFARVGAAPLSQLSAPGVTVAAIFSVFIYLMIASSPALAAESGDAQPQSQADYVGAAACKQCHESEFKAWTGSHHQLAMQDANATAVLGDFDNAKFKHYSVESTFFKRDGKFMVRTDGADGKLAVAEALVAKLEGKR